MNFFWKFLTPKSTKRFFWKEQLNSYIEEKQIICEEEISDVINLFVKDKIAPDKFTANMSHVITNGNDRFCIGLHPRTLEMLEDQTKSIISACVGANRRKGIPFWFYAAYPDVLVWLSKKEHEFTDELVKRSFKLFGIDEEQILKKTGLTKREVNLLDEEKKDKIFEEKFILNNSCGYIKFEYLKNLVDNFKKETKKNKMETSTKNI